MFDPRRFGRLAAVQWTEHRREYLWFFGIGIAVHACSWFVLTEAGMRPELYDLGEQFFVYWLGYAVTALIFAGRQVSMLARPESALTWLMRPASGFEKFVLMLLMVMVAYPLLYALAFQVCNLPATALAVAADNAREAAPSERYMGPYLPFATAVRPAEEMGNFLIVNTLQAVVLAGLLYFRGLSWLKTLVAVFVLVVIALPLLVSVTDANPRTLIPGLVDVPGGFAVDAWRWTLWIGVPGLFWTSVYGFLRDRELT